MGTNKYILLVLLNVMNFSILYPDTISDNQIDALFDAIEKDDANAIKNWIGIHKNVNIIHSVHNETPLMKAIDGECMKAIDVLLKNEADVNLGNGFMTPLGLAISKHQVQVESYGHDYYPALTKSMLEHGANPNSIQSKDKNNPNDIFYCAKTGDHEQLNLLFSYGGNVNIHIYSDNLLTTILKKYDFSDEYDETIKLLIDKGIDLQYKDGDGKTALDLIAESKFYNLIKYVTTNVEATRPNDDTVEGEWLITGIPDYFRRHIKFIGKTERDTKLLIYSNTKGKIVIPTSEGHDKIHNVLWKFDGNNITITIFFKVSTKEGKTTKYLTENLNGIYANNSLIFTNDGENIIFEKGDAELDLIPSVTPTNSSSAQTPEKPDDH